MQTHNKTETTDTAAPEADTNPTGIVIVEGKAKVTDLRPHPENVKIYGDNDSVSDLIKNIQESGKGILEPLLITAAGEIIGGHRRFRAARDLGLEEVPVRVFRSTDELEIYLVLLGLNRQRVKTGVQIANEATLQTRIRKQIREREKQQRVAEGENLPLDSKGKLRDEVAQELGLSGRTVDKAVKTSEAITKLREEGKEEDAQEIETALNKSIDGGLKLAVKKGAVAAPKQKKQTVRATIPEKGVDAASATLRQVAEQTEEILSEVSSESVPTESAAVIPDSDTALTHADHALTSLRSNSAQDMNEQQRRDWTKVLNQITTCQAALNL